MRTERGKECLFFYPLRRLRRQLSQRASLYVSFILLDAVLQKASPRGEADANADGEVDKYFTFPLLSKTK